MRAEVWAFGGRLDLRLGRRLAELVEREPKGLVLSFAGNTWTSA